MGRATRWMIAAIAAVAVVAAVALAVTSGHGGSTVATTTTTGQGVAAPPPISLGPGTGRLNGLGTTVAPDPLATSVRATGALGDGVTDDTAAFERAMVSALTGRHRFAKGPSGPQAVVSVPPGTYRIFRLLFESNVRLEVDAGAVLEQAGGRYAGQGKTDAAYLIVWDGTSATAPLTNVSIVGVGSRPGGMKSMANPVAPGWSIDNSFTMDLDPKATDANEKVGGMELLNVDGFLVQNLYSIENDTLPDLSAVQANKGVYPWPTSDKAVIVLRSRNDTPLGGPYLDPQNGAIVHHYNIHAPYGYGPNQFESAHNVSVSQIFSDGGTALRLETDTTKNKTFGGELKGITADTIMGVNCNRAVSFSPHGQMNSDVHVSHVVASSCHQGVIESVDSSLGAARRGAFLNSTVTAMSVFASSQAQNPTQTGGSLGTWVVGESMQSFARESKAQWDVSFTDISCSGTFTLPADPINVDGKLQRPQCAA